MDRRGAAWRLWVGALGLLLCLWLFVSGVADTRGDLGMMAAFGAVVLSPLPGSCLLSGLGLKYRWRPDILYRALPLLVLATYLLLAIVGFLL
jgi:hypothetical protein